MRLTPATLLILAATGHVGAGAGAQQVAQLHQVFSSDSLIAGFAQTSPDGKWVVFTARRGLNASLWIAPTAGGPPVRLTSEGHNDQVPVWFASGDRISFASTRPNRNVGRQQYLMTLAIDPGTGQAVGAPRQVSSEPIGDRGGSPSPDGRWLAYASTGTSPELKVVPVNGGTARVLAPAGLVSFGPVFGPDGEYVYYTEQAIAAGTQCPGTGCGYSVRRVPTTGGASTVLATENHPVAVLRGDPRYLVHFVDLTPPLTQHLEIRTLAGETVASLEGGPDMRLLNSSGDGLGTMGIRNESDYSIRIATVAGGPLHVLTAGGKNWSAGWMPDGSAVITDRTEGGRIVVEVLPLGAGDRKRIPLPPQAKNSGWNSSVGPWLSYQTRDPAALHAINVVTSQTRDLTQAIANVFVIGRGGRAQDGPRFIYGERTGNRIGIRSTDPETGATETIRNVPAGAARRPAFHVHGKRAAWFEARADSFDLLLATGPAANPRRLATYLFAEMGADPWERLAWSWKGDRLAVCRRSSGGDHRAFVTLIDVPVTSAGPSGSRDVDLSGWSQCWQTQWLPNDSGLLTLAVRSGTDKPDILHVPLGGGEQPKAITRDETNPIWEYLTSPDGLQVAYPVSLPVTRSSIWVANFKPMLEQSKSHR